jgi:uncharacterized membrane protein
MKREMRQRTRHRIIGYLIAAFIATLFGGLLGLAIWTAFSY